MSIRVVSPVPGEVVDVGPVGIEIASLRALRTGEQYSFLLKRGFNTERLRARVKWCLVEPMAPRPSGSSPVVYHCCLAAQGLNRRVLRFLDSEIDH